MQINTKILNKFIRYQREVMDYYNLEIRIWISTFQFNDEMHQVETFNIGTLGYEWSDIDSGVDDGYMSKECFKKRLKFLGHKYPLLHPFYSVTHI